MTSPRRAALVPSLAVLAACNVGPRYVAPEVVVPVAFKEGAPAAYGSLPPDTWQPANPQDAALKGNWWEAFHEADLDALEAQLDINNQTIAQYFQNFMAARAQVDQARAGYFPTVTVSPTYLHSSGAGGAAVAGVGSPSATTTGAPAGATGTTGSMGTTTMPATTSNAGSAGTSTASAGSGNFFVLPLEASWAPDLWGRVHNTVREYTYAAQVSAADLENERLTEQAALAEYYFELRGQDSLQELYDRTIAAYLQSLAYTRAQSTVGIGTEEAVAQAEVTEENAAATAVGIATNRALYEHAIATLIGQPASSFALPPKPLVAAVPPIPLGVPSRLLERRPDIAAAERTMAQANALVGVGKAAYYPSLNLSGEAGFASNALGTLFSAPAFFWSLGASLSETVFEGGLRRATVAQYVAMYRADVAAYRQTVLVAFQQVEDYVATLRVLSQQIRRQESATRAAQRYVDIAVAQYQTGLQPYLDVITAQTTLLSDQQALVTLRVNQMMAAVQLIQALGGGWNAKEP